MTDDRAQAIEDAIAARLAQSDAMRRGVPTAELPPLDEPTERTLAALAGLPVYRVAVSRMVEQTAIVEVSAESVEAAVEAAEAEMDAPSVKWTDGDTITDEHAYAVMDAAGVTIWER